MGASLHQDTVKRALSCFGDPLLDRAVRFAVDIVLNPARMVVPVGFKFVLDDLPDEGSRVLRTDEKRMW